MVTSLEIFLATRHLFKPVPPESLPNVCYLCLGAVTSAYDRCYNCRNLFHDSHPSLDQRVVPMTIALNPSAWFWVLQTYKTAQFREHASTVGALAYRWLEAHAERLRHLLGGNADYVAAVPSKKSSTPVERQPLRRALGVVTPLAQRIRDVLRCARPTAVRLKEYRPEIFEVTADVSGDRIILVEDTWITGATVLSAAGALLDAGAASVVLTPIARDMKPSFHGEDHPYLRHLDHEYDIGAWPR